MLYNINVAYRANSQNKRLHGRCGKDILMADSKLVNEHRAWLKDAEKGKTIACILAIVMAVYNIVISVTCGFTGFFIFLILLFTAISGGLIFSGRGAGRAWLIVTELWIIIGTMSGFLVDEEVDFFAMFIAVLVRICVPIACFIFTFVSFYVRRYFTFMVAYKAKKIYL